MTDQTRYSRSPGGLVHRYAAACCDSGPVCTPVVVLDPADESDVERLRKVLASYSDARSILDALLSPEPVTEPGGGAYAVVKDGEGDLWVRDKDGLWGNSGCDWDMLVRHYGPLTVLREGVGTDE